MIYLFTIYIVFQVVYDNWLPDGGISNDIYFAFQYAWIAAVSILQAVKGRYYIFYYTFALIMLIFSICEFLQINQAPPGLTWFSIVIIIFLILSVRKWNGSKTILGKHC
jgi:hypothetical protein